MKRFLKVATLLIVSLFVLVSGVDATLDHISHTPAQGSYTIYSQKGIAVITYTGDLRFCKFYLKPSPSSLPDFVHRS